VSREFSIRDLWPFTYNFLRPAIVIPAFELIWGILTLSTAYVHNVTQLYIIRFLSGIFECVAFPGVIYCIGCWYKKDEIGKPQQAYEIANVQT
jgi:MFS transporter, ACS family, pantothenate transporter